MKEIILQKCNFRCRENIYICRPLRRLRRLAVEYVKNILNSEIFVELFYGTMYNSISFEKKKEKFKDFYTPLTKTTDFQGFQGLAKAVVDFHYFQALQGPVQTLYIRDYTYRELSKTHTLLFIFI